MTFRDPIVAGEELIRSAIRSENFVTLVSGWRIARDGAAEFENLVSRGSFTAVGVSSTAVLNSGVLEIFSNSSSGVRNSYENGLIQFTEDNYVSRVVEIAMDSDLGIRLRKQGVTRTVVFNGGNGFLHAGSGSSYALEEWNTLSLSASWVADGETPQYRMYPDGTVALRGNLKDGTTAAGTVFANVPSGYRPGQAMRFITAEKQAGTAFRHIRVSTNGDIDVFNCTTAHICLDGIRYSII